MSGKSFFKGIDGEWEMDFILLIEDQIYLFVGGNIDWLWRLDLWYLIDLQLIRDGIKKQGWIFDPRLIRVNM